MCICSFFGRVVVCVAGGLQMSHGISFTCLYGRAGERTHAHTHKIMIRISHRNIPLKKRKRQVGHLILGRVGKYVCIGITEKVFNFPSPDIT